MSAAEFDAKLPPDYGFAELDYSFEDLEEQRLTRLQSFSRVPIDFTSFRHLLYRPVSPGPYGD